MQLTTLTTALDCPTIIPLVTVPHNSNVALFSSKLKPAQAVDVSLLMLLVILSTTLLTAFES